MYFLYVLVKRPDFSKKKVGTIKPCPPYFCNNPGTPIFVIPAVLSRDPFPVEVGGLGSKWVPAQRRCRDDDIEMTH
jgi:hypothetical protein